MQTTVDADRELLLAALRRHAAALPTSVVFALSAAADELVDPLVPPTLRTVGESETADLLHVVRSVRERLDRASRSSSVTHEAMACARAARELASVEQALAGLRPR